MTTVDAYRLLKRTLDRLDEWESSSPIYSSFTSLFQLPSYMQVLGQKERLWLSKLLIDSMPTQDGCPPLDLLNICQGAATNVILEYDKSRQVPHLVYYLRADLHLVFLAGVSLLLGIAVKDRLLQRMFWDGLARLPVHQEDLLQSNSAARSAEDALKVCADLLQEITEVLEEGAFLKEIFHLFVQFQRPMNDDHVQRLTSVPEDSELHNPPIGPRLAGDYQHLNQPNATVPTSGNQGCVPQFAAPNYSVPVPGNSFDNINAVHGGGGDGGGESDEIQWMTGEVWDALLGEMNQQFNDPSAEFGNWSFY